MTSAFAQKAGLSLFTKHLEQYEPVDPVYETYTDNKGRQRRRRRELPPGLSARDAKVLKSVQRRAHYLDKGFRICGMRFGWTFVIGIVPGAGDVADAALNYILVVRKACEAEIPGWLLQRMLVNNAVSIGLGLIPIAGDVALASFKANSRNAALLEEFLRIRGDEFLKAQARRKEKEEVVKPGAGREEGERIERPGGRKNSGFTKLFGSRKSKRAQPTATGTNADAVAGSAALSVTPVPGTGIESTEAGKGKAKAKDGTQEGRFVENMPTPSP